MNAILQPTTVTLMPRVAIHRFLIVVRVIRATLGMDLPVQVIQMFAVLYYSLEHNCFKENAIDHY